MSNSREAIKIISVCIRNNCSFDDCWELLRSKNLLTNFTLDESKYNMLFQDVRIYLGG